MRLAKLNVAYLIYNERPNASLIRHQVIDLLKYIAADNKITLTLICLWNPLIYCYYWKDISLIRRTLSAHSVDVENYPIAIFPNRYFTSIYVLLKLLMSYLSSISKFMRLNRFDIVHARSYLASYIITSYSGKRYKTIFDVRSLLPEENIVIKKWELYSKTYNLWKSIEKYIINNSDSAVVVSGGMRKKIRRIGCDDYRICHIPLLADTNKFQYNEDDRISLRAQLGVEHKFVMAYVGSLGDSDVLNNIRNYAKYIKHVVAMNNEIIFLFVVPAIEDYYEKIMTCDYGIPKNLYMFVEGKNKIQQYLSSADAGINIMSYGPDTSTRFGVKVVEYLSSGLPVMLKNVGGAEEILDKIDAGIVLENEDMFARQLRVFMDTKYDRKKISNHAVDFFSLQSVTNKYINLYRDITCGTCS